MDVKSDNGGEFNGGNLGKLFHERNIKQGFTTTDSPEYNGMAEPELAIVESAALATRIQVPELFPRFDVPRDPCCCACDAYQIQKHVHRMRCSTRKPRRRARYPF